MQGVGSMKLTNDGSKFKRSALEVSNNLNMEPSELAQSLHDYITTTTALSNIFILLRLSNIEDLKAFAHKQIDKMNTDILRTAHRTVMPIDTILSGDVLQHILSFGEFYSNIENRRVCKQWNRLYALNEENMLRTVYRWVNDQYPEKLSPENRTWIMHEARTVLHPIEKQLGYQGPLCSLDAVHKRCKSGDRVLVHETVSTYSYDFEYTEFGQDDFIKDIHLIGVSPLKYGRCGLSLGYTSVYGGLTLENLTLYTASPKIGSDDPSKQSIEGPRKLTLRKCNIYSAGEISVMYKASLEMEYCTVSPHTRTRFKYLGFDLFPWAKTVDISNNTIRGFKRGIAIQRWNPDPRGMPELARIDITDNVFEGISEYAVVERTDFRRNQEIKIKGTGRCTLRGNTINTCSTEVPDPNILHHIKEDHEEYPEDYGSTPTQL